MYSSPVSLTPSLYRNGVVPIIRVFAQFMSWLDRNLVDGVVNLVGSLTLFSGNNLKYSTIGQTQFYVLTILLGTALLGICLCWSVFSDFFLV
jgi:NAD(P)H-quinone oxidoreductase subunit 5